MPLKSKVERDKYNKWYRQNKRVNAKRKKNEFTEESLRGYFPESKGMGEQICETFGCIVRLSLIEQMAGRKCTECMNQPKIEPTKFINYNDNTAKYNNNKERWEYIEVPR